MTTWTQTSTIPGQRCWRRPLGLTETAYYWNGVWNGTSDTIIHAHLRITRPTDVVIYALKNIHRAWTSVKRRFPLVAAEVLEEDDGLHFVIQEQNVYSIRDEDVTIAAVSSFRDAERFITENLDGPRPISGKLPTRLYVLRRTDEPSHFHLVLPVSHHITDGCSTSTILRSFLQTLATSFDPCPLPIEERLQMYSPMETRIFPKTMSLVKRRWKRAIGYAFYVVRRSWLQGGHTLPGNFTHATATTPAKSRLLVTPFSLDASALILANCQRYNITFNAAYHALSQVALSRLLCRRYLRGEISEEEWEYRKRQPMLFIGLVNLRPYLIDQDWFQSGGSGEVGLNFSFYQHILPFMPLGAMASKNIELLQLADGAPHFRDLMSFERFLLRCEWVRLASEKLFRNPMFLEICVATHSDILEPNAKRAENWRRAGERVIPGPEAQQPVPYQAPWPVFAQRGASLGDMDHMIPLNYPLPATHQLSPLSPSSHPHRAGYPACTVADSDVVLQCETPRLHVEYWQTHYRSRPGEIYVGAVSSKKRLQYFTFYDLNVHTTDIVQELMDELKEATLWYLGRPRESVASGLKCKL